MKTSKIILASIFSVSILCGCSNQKAQTYTLGFYQSEKDQLDEMTVTIGKTTYQDVLAFQRSIKINEVVGYDVKWEQFDFEHLDHDYVVDAQYILHEYVISFKYIERVVATTTYTIKSQTIEMPEFEDINGYTFVPESFEFKGKHEDFTVQVSREETPYTAIFVTDENVSTTLTYTISNPVVYAPSGPKGYDTKWTSGSTEVKAGEAIDFTGKLGHYTFNRNSTPKEYKIKYVNDGTVIQEQTVTYDSPYTLIDVISPNPDYDGVAWVTEDAREFPQTGTWQLDHDIELSATWGLSFEKDTPSAVVLPGNRVNYSIDSTQGTSGSKCLRVDIETHSGETGDYGVNIAKSFLEDCFADPDVVAVNFDAKASFKTSNFRSVHSEGGTVGGWTYENNYTPMGIDTNWKTFSFKREYLEGYQYLASGWLNDGETVWIDNIRAVKHHLDGDIIGFENGMITTNSSGAYIAYNGGHANANPAQKQVFLAQGVATQTVAFDYEIKHEGNRSIKVTKAGDYSAIYISTALVDYLGEEGYITVDVYSTVGCNSNPSNAVLLDGLSTNYSLEKHATGLGGDGYVHPANTWVTYTLGTSRMTADGRFMQITGSTAGDWYFDNITLHPQA